MQTLRPPVVEESSRVVDRPRPADHAASPDRWLGRSIITPFSKRAPARTRATRCGALSVASVAGRLEQLERHRQAGRPGAGALGHPGSELDGGEGRLDRVGGPQMHPVLGREGEKCVSSVLGASTTGDRLGLLGGVLGGERVDRSHGVARSRRRIMASARFAFGCTDCRQGCPGRWRSCGPSSSVAGLGPDVAGAAQNPSAPSPTATTGARIPRRSQVAQHLSPALGGLPIAVLDRDQLLRAVGAHPDQTRQHSRSSSRRMLKWTPSAHTYT